MKVFILTLGLLMSSLASAGWKQEARAILKEYNYACNNSEVIIDSISRNEWIKGHVNGIPTEALSKMKMVFFVKTNRWYVHPYTYTEGQEEGYSYTYLNADGTFKIKTIRRDVPAKKLAAVLVPRPYQIQNQHIWLNPFLGIFGGITKYSCNYTVVNGNGDFFME